MKKVVVMFVSAAALATVGMAAASNSMAASDNSSNDSAGVYIAGDLGYGASNVRKSDYFSAPHSIKTGSFAWDANLGYQFNRYLAVEAGYIHFGQTKADFGSNGGGVLTSEFGGFDADVKGILPLSDKFNLFAKAGVVDMHESFTTSPASVAARKLNGSAWTPILGIGAAFNITHHVALNLQDVYSFRTSYGKILLNQHETVHIPANNAILAGVSYKFSV